MANERTSIDITAILLVPVEPLCHPIVVLTTCKFNHSSRRFRKAVSERLLSYSANERMSDRTCFDEQKYYKSYFVANYNRTASDLSIRF
jgi:hypothetical protein